MDAIDPSSEGISEGISRIERALVALTEEVKRINAALERIDRVVDRNTAVAEKYGDRADSLFSVVDAVNSVMHRANPLTYIPRFSVADKEEESD